MKKNIGILLILFSFQSFASDLKMVGTFLLEYSIFKIDVYQISYFKGTDSEKLVLDYKVDVKKKHSLEGWKVGLAHELKDEIRREKAQWLFDHTYDVKKGDGLSIVKTGELLEIYLNDKLMGSTTDPVIRQLAFEPWLGEKPVDAKLKASLLGKTEK